jgi:hypothetical protein
MSGWLIVVIILVVGLLVPAFGGFAFARQAEKFERDPTEAARYLRQRARRMMFSVPLGGLLLLLMIVKGRLPLVSLVALVVPVFLIRSFLSQATLLEAKSSAQEPKPQ